MIVDQLYNLRPIDMHGQMWGPVHGFDDASAAATVVKTDDASVASKMPNSNHVLILKNFQAFGTPGGALTMPGLSVSIRDPASNFLTNLATLQTLGESGINWSGEVVLVLGYHQLRVTGTFSAATSTNSVSLYWSGIAVPRGNVTLF